MESPTEQKKHNRRVEYCLFPGCLNYAQTVNKICSEHEFAGQSDGFSVSKYWKITRDIHFSDEKCRRCSNEARYEVGNTSVGAKNKTRMRLCVGCMYWREKTLGFRIGR